MSPVYGLLEPRKETDVRLTFKGTREGSTLENERFTIVIALAPNSEHRNARKLWHLHKSKDPNDREVLKKKVPIIFSAEQSTSKGQDETLITAPPIIEDPEDDFIRAPKARIRRMSRGSVDDDVAYTQRSNIGAPGPMKAVKTNVGEEVDEKSVSGEESRSLTLSRSSTRRERHKAKQPNAKETRRSCSVVQKSEAHNILDGLFYFLNSFA
ncbi:unnamed protein product [Cylicocyclus nassatus]|uniref:Uncharacterized protein n=1 Tax=Cylicocyclus nassatus TaxID=53992 RepID=A0AA36H9M1_CYLNA|nr:unnamed protein product [Cylicocyclus nassatus]